MAASYGEEVLDAPTVMDAEKIKALTADRGSSCSGRKLRA